MMDEYVSRSAVLTKGLDVKSIPDDLIGAGIMVWLDGAKNRIRRLPAADVAPVAHGRWVHTDKHLWYKNEDGSIDEWRLDVGFHNGPECEVCGECFCMHCHPDYTELKCKVGHYVCSKCGEASRDGHEKYCPCCGAKMDGGPDNGK